MSKAGGKWHLESRERPEKKPEKELLLKFLHSSIKEAKDVLTAKAAQGEDEEVLIELATRHFARLNDFMREATRLSAPSGAPAAL